MPFKYGKMPEIMSAILGEEIKNLKELTSGIRIASILSKIDPKFFNFFNPKGLYCFGLSNCSTSSDITKKGFKIWKKLLNSLRDYCIEIQQNSSKFFEENDDKSILVEKMSQFGCIFGGFEDESIEKILRDDDDEMSYFCTILTLFLKTTFNKQWKFFEKKMSGELISSFNAYLSNFQKSSTFSEITHNSKYTRKSLKTPPQPSKIQNSLSQQFVNDNLTEYELLDILDDRQAALHEVIAELGDKKREITGLKSTNDQLRISLKYKDQMAEERNNQIRYLEQRLSAFKNTMSQEVDSQIDLQKLKISYNRVSEEKNVLERENLDLRKQIENLKGKKFDLEQELKSTRGLVNFQLKSCDSFLEDNKFVKDLKDECKVKDIRIENLQIRMKELRNQLVIANKNTENLESYLKKKEKKVIESEREIAGLEDKMKYIELENSRLKEDLENFREENFNILRSNARIRAEKRSEVESVESLNMNKMGSKHLERLNMNKTLEEVALVYTEELSCLYSLMHDVFVNELTGEGLQDLVEKKLWEKDRDRLRVMERMVVG